MGILAIWAMSFSMVVMSLASKLNEILILAFNVLKIGITIGVGYFLYNGGWQQIIGEIGKAIVNAVV